MTGGWTKKTLFTLADQAVFSGSMFAINILLVRWTSPQEYGAFAVLFAIFLILSGIHNALVIEPMTVFGSKKEQQELSPYMAGVYLLHGIVVIAIAAVAIVIALMIGHDSLTIGRWALPIATPLVLCFWLVRRKCYVMGNPVRAFTLSLSYGFLAIAGVSVLHRVDHLSAFSAFLVFGISGFTISLIPMWRTIHFSVVEAARSFRSLLHRHWTYGRWAFGESIMFALGTSIYPLLIAYFGGVDQAGEFRAMHILFLPLNHLLTALGLILLPWLSRRRAVDGDDLFSRRAYTVLILFVSLAVVYLLPVTLLGSRIASMLYDSPEFVGMVWILPYLGIATMFTVVSTALMIFLRAAERPDCIFLAVASSAGVTVVLGSLLIAFFGTYGLAIALVASSVTATALLYWSSRSLVLQRLNPSFSAP